MNLCDLFVLLSMSLIPGIDVGIHFVRQLEKVFCEKDLGFSSIGLKGHIVNSQIYSRRLAKLDPQNGQKLIRSSSSWTVSGSIKVVRKAKNVFSFLSTTMLLFSRRALPKEEQQIGGSNLTSSNSVVDIMALASRDWLNKDAIPDSVISQRTLRYISEITDLFYNHLSFISGYCWRLAVT